MKVICKVCNKEFNVNPSLASTAKFCSIECRDRKFSYDELKEIVKPFKFKSIADYKVEARKNEWPLSPGAYFEKRGIDFNAEDFLSKEIYKFKNLDELIEGIQFYNENNPQDIIDTTRKYKVWSTKNGAPSDPKRSYRLDSIDWKYIFETKKSLKKTIDFFKEKDITSDYRLRTSDRSDWPKYVYMTSNALELVGFDWSLVTGSKKEKVDWAPMTESISYYKTLMSMYNLTNISRQMVDYEIPSNIPRDPVSVYKSQGFSWSLVTGKSNGVVEAKINRIEIARLIVSHVDIIDTLDDTFVAIALSKLYDNVKLSDLVKCEIKKMVNKVISDKKQGDRKEALLEVASKIEEASNFDDMIDDVDMVQVVDSESDNIDSVNPDNVVDDLENESNETIMTVDYEKRLKNIVRVTNENILNNDDLDVDVKELMLKNATKALWYLECSK